MKKRKCVKIGMVGVGLIPLAVTLSLHVSVAGEPWTADYDSRSAAGFDL